MKLFTPYGYLKNVYQLDLNQVKEDGFNTILCDLDNTLVGHDVKDPDQRTIDLINACKEEGIKFIIFSNNTEKRVSAFCENLDVKFYANSKKPLKSNYKKIISENHLEIEKTLAIGDQILTDVAGANRIGFKAVLVDQLQQKDLIWTKINRSIENVVYYFLAKKDLLKRGRYYYG
jgi:HAD superfamily phosphatase (TIGR01668 family)